MGQAVSQDHERLLDLAEKAMESFMREDKVEQPDGMDMVYYFPIVLSQIQRDVEDEIPTLGQVMSHVLTLNGCTFASIVYIAYENKLIFDRYQDGLLIPNLGVVFGTSKQKKSIAVVGVPTCHDDTVSDAASLPGVILEFILTFLPDTAVASMTRVCSAWHNEIGMSSSHAWQDLLDRRMWPHCVRVDGSSQEDEAQRSFKKHYEVVRDLHAVNRAIV